MIFKKFSLLQESETITSDHIFDPPPIGFKSVYPKNPIPYNDFWKKIRDPNYHPFIQECPTFFLHK